MDSTQEQNLKAALERAAAGLKIFPTTLAKVPVFEGWQHLATSDADTIRKWFRRPHLLPAIACGASGLVVVDCDRHHDETKANGKTGASAEAPDGVANFKGLLDENHTLPIGVPVVRTPRDGTHIYFKQPKNGEPLGNSRGALPAGVDIRGVGGFVIAPGATLPNGKGWFLAGNRSPIEQAPPLPSWLEGMLRPAPAVQPEIVEPTGATDDGRGRAYAEAALGGIESELASTAEGTRNERLYKASFRLATMMARGWVTQHEITAALEAACLTNGYTKEHGVRSTRSTIRGGLSDGARLPHPDLAAREPEPARTGPGEAKPGKQRTTGDWNEPDTSILDDRRGELPEFPIDFQASWLGWLQRAAHGAGVTPAHVAVPLLAAASGLAGTSRRVVASRSWSEPLTLWTAVVGFSGTGKTPGADVALRALAKVESDRKGRVAAHQLAHETKVEAAKAARKKWERELAEAVDAGAPAPPKPVEAAEPGKFIVPRLFASNVTVERWASLLTARPSGLLMFRDELAGHFLNMSRYTNGQDNEFWLESFNGKHYVVERQSAPALVIDHLLIGICGGFQPDKLARSFDGDHDGMYARICFAWPSAATYRRLADEVDETDPELVNALTRLADLPRVDESGALAVQTARLSTEGREEFEQFRQFVHEGLSPLDGREREWRAKGPTHALRLAGTLAYLEWAWHGGPEPTEVGARYVRDAVQLWREYFWPHARAALRVIGQSDRNASARAVLRWIKASGLKEVSPKDLRRDALGHKLDAEQTLTLIEFLGRAGWLREIPSPASGPGRPARRWAVNPKLASNHGP